MNDQCECDRDIHKNTPCTDEAQEYDDVIPSPALCIPCLFVCWNDDEESQRLNR